METSFCLPVTFDDVKAASRRLSGHVYDTEVIYSHYLSERTDADIHLRCENIQRSGSFKIRGAFNKLSLLTPEEKSRGVVTCSAGNHAQGVALSSAMLHVNAKVVMPETAPRAKVEATRSYQAEVILHGKNFNETIEEAMRIAKKESRVFVPPYDDVAVVAGQGTVGLEILSAAADVDNIIVPVGGGGLIAGVAVAAKAINPNIRIIGVQSQNVHGMAASLEAGKIVSHRISGTIADGCDVATPGVIPFTIAKALVDEVVLVSENEICTALLALIERNKLLSEGAGALSIAALLSGKVSGYIHNKKTVCVVSGGNIDLSRLAAIIETSPAR